MTISSTTQRVDYTGDGAHATYSYTFKIFASTDLLVTIRDTSNVETTKVLTTDYTVTGVGETNGGTITLVAGNLTSGYLISISRNVPNIQSTDIRNQGAFYAATHEDEFDNLQMQLQRLNALIGRSIHLPEADQAGLTVTLPASGVRASTYLAFDASGNVTTSIISAGVGAYFQVEAADIIGLRDGTNPMSFNIYNTYTNASNYERTSLFWSANVFGMLTQAAGTGSARNMRIGTAGASVILFQTSGADRWQMNTSGHIIASTTNVYDIGATGNVPRSIYWGTQALGPDGGNTAPSFSFAGQTAWGMYRVSDGLYWTASSGSDQMSLHTTGNLELISTGAFCWGSTGSGSTADVLLVRDAAAVLALKNSTTAQEFRIYGTTTGPKYLSLKHDGTDGIVDTAASSGKLKLGGNASDMQWGKALVALGGGAAPTFGTIGGSGPATAAQNSWLRMLDSTGAACWMAVWK